MKLLEPFRTNATLPKCILKFRQIHKFGKIQMLSENSGRAESFYSILSNLRGREVSPAGSFPSDRL